MRRWTIEVDTSPEDGESASGDAPDAGTRDGIVGTIR